ncbi:ABC transporter ATP-binding protein [Desulfolutivibrio sulfoxidireducens]|uniref:ABC transporter ATP-binding protein n=1 Tax=Desulfolutivibrio sulfoxidireducens TaxID=2773299 RepID=UPI00159D82ED|nr:ATP-binding cassette domain-containing protein [Desulfolutivibrio sulfoxidireducens]QLA20557.1 ATP-binding cassette domain-containing protein [Desulfolutivibrio sulfoxidireducens]
MRISIDVEKRLNGSRRSFTLAARFATDEGRVVLFGPSGSGKSLTLRAVAGLLRPDAGRIAVDGKVLFDSREGVDIAVRKRRVGFVFQDYALFPHLTVQQNTAFGLVGLWGRRTREIRERVEAMLDLFGLTRMADSLPGELSGGQRQRVALARAVAPGPAILLLDEPFSALDLPLRARLREEVLNLLEQLGIPLILVTHDPEEAVRFATVAVPYRKGETGELIDIGTKDCKETDRPDWPGHARAADRLVRCTFDAVEA